MAGFVPFPAIVTTSLQDLTRRPGTVRATLRRGGTLDDVAAILLRAVAHKPSGHRLAIGRFTEERQMFQIGG